MSILDLTIIIFMILEISNVLILYFSPNSKKGNGMSNLKTYTELSKDNNYKDYNNYMVKWVANVKLIFISLLVVILFTGSDMTKVWTVTVLAFTTAIYYFNLSPIMKRLDKDNKLDPKGYSKTLDKMISVIIFMFVISIILYFTIK